jgi:hypothetical protein
MPTDSAVRLCAETLRFAVSPIDPTVEAAFPMHRGATVKRFRRRAFLPPAGSIVFRHIERAVGRIIHSRLVIRETLQTRLAGCFRLELHQRAETLQIRTRHRRGHLKKPTPQRRSAADRTSSSGRAFKPPSASDGHRCACALDPDVPSDLPPDWLRPPGSPCFGAEAPRWGPSFELSPSSLVPVGGAVLLCAKDAWVSDFAVCARIPDRYTKRKTLGGSVLQAVPVSRHSDNAGLQGAKAL